MGPTHAWTIEILESGAWQEILRRNYYQHELWTQVWTYIAFRFQL